MSKEYRLQLPITESQVRELRLGDVVYLSGKVVTLRDMTHGRAVEIVRKGEDLPFDLRNSAIWHCAPIVKQDATGKWHITAAGSTTSSRFTYTGSELVKKYQTRITVGKGTMWQAAVDVMKEIGSCYLNTTGGTAALYAQKVEDVEEVFWLDLGLPESAWVLRVKDIGPFIVGIDSLGNSLYENMRKEMNKKLLEQCKKHNIKLDYTYAYLPLDIAGKARSIPSCD
jgi:fumarate hydratase subunit beta